VTAKHARIEAASKVNGGWEGWCQVDMLMRALNDQLYKYERERFIYGTLERVDLWLEPKADAPHGTLFRGVELKCGTGKHNTVRTVKTELKKDMAYVTTNKAVVGNDPYMYAIGLTPFLVDTEGYDGASYSGHVHVETLYDGGLGAPALYMVFIKCRWDTALQYYDV
jgi:predicted metalloprotease